MTLKICRTHFRKFTLKQSASRDFRGFTFFFFDNNALESFFFFSSAIIKKRIVYSSLVQIQMLALAESLHYYSSLPEKIKNKNYHHTINNKNKKEFQNTYTLQEGLLKGFYSYIKTIKKLYKQSAYFIGYLELIKNGIIQLQHLF